MGLTSAALKGNKMENAGFSWDFEEDQQLKKLFSQYKMDISEIAQIHKRSINAIKLRLIKFQLIEDDSKDSIVWNKVVEIAGNKSVPNKLKLISDVVSSFLNEYKERIDVLESKVKFLTERLEVSGLD